MAKVGRLTKLKSAIKRWPSIAKLARSTSCSVSVAAVNDSANIGEDMSTELHTVYVGKSRRRYLVGSDVVVHPLFQELVDKSSSPGDSGDGVFVVSCEVVLFEHLLWMIENAAATQLGSTSELVEFYTC